MAQGTGTVRMQFKFKTPTDSVMPTVDIAVVLLAGRLERFVTGLENMDQFLRHLRVFYIVTEHLWQGAMHLASLTNVDEDTRMFLDEITGAWGKEWNCLADVIVKDAVFYGVCEEHFMFPTKDSSGDWEERKPHACASLSQLLGCQFHTDDVPSIFLMRQLAMRILFMAYAQSVHETVTSEFIQRARFIKLPWEWCGVPELSLAAGLYTEKQGASSQIFSNRIYEEVCLMADIFELVLRQLQDPLPARIEC